jgi:hypothetical protein
MRIKINQQHPFALLSQQTAKRYNRGRFTHPTFLVSHCPNFHYTASYSCNGYADLR